MKFLLDHDVPDRIAGVIQAAGFSALKLREILPPDLDDEAVFRHARDHGLILITCNRDDFLPLAAAGVHAGLIILIRRKTRIAECSAILRLIRRAGPVGIEGNINFA